MIDASAIGEIITVYQKYGWVLRRVLLTAKLKKHLGAAVPQLFNGVQIIDSDIDAAWFSRPPQSGGVAWEIRHLSDEPYALLEELDEKVAEFEDSIQIVESRLRENLSKNKSP